MLRIVGLSVVIAADLTMTLVTGQAPAPGHRLFGGMQDTETVLMDANGSVVHRWQSQLRPGISTYLEPDGTLLRTGLTRPIINGAGGALQRIALDGSIVWDYRYDGPGVLSHHDIERLPNGNVLMIAWEDKTHAEAVQAGRNPALLASGPFRPDHVIEVQQTGLTTGSIVWEWHVWDHLIQDFDSTQSNHGVVADHPELIDLNFPGFAPRGGDYNHFNTISYDPVHDRIILSARQQNEIWVIDHSTTTAEAAGHSGGRWGHGGDLLYRWGNPEAYRAGSQVDQLIRAAHGAYIIPEGMRGAGNLLFFNNLVGAPGNELSEAWELALPMDATGRFVRGRSQSYGPAGPLWTFSDPLLDSSFISNCERLPNGNTLICSGAQGWIIEVTPAGQIVWPHQAPSGSIVFHAHYYEQSLWADGQVLSVSTGGSVQLDVLAGSQFAGDPYLLLGSTSGTQPGFVAGGVRIPLNVDGYLVNTLSAPNQFPLGGTAGTLDPRGRALASFTLPAGILPSAAIGLRFDHACLVFDAATGAVRTVSNAVGFELIR